MQASSLSFTVILPAKRVGHVSAPRKLAAGAYRRPTRLAASPESLTVDYSSSNSVFPAEACETVGGEACAAEMFPEVKPAPPQPGAKAAAAEEVDREYLDYSEPKTVFPGEACDDLGGEFCNPEYQQGVFKDTAAA